jgi:hypothetical protein
MSPSPDAAPASDERLARAAATAAAAVPGVIRLQPGLRHLAGRAARALFTGENAHDVEGDLDGISIDRDPDLNVTLRIVVAGTPPPRQVAAQVHAAVSRAVTEIWGAPATVTIVIVDVEG